MIEVDTEAEIAKYQEELSKLIVQFQQAEDSRNLLAQAINGRKVIIAYLNSLKQNAPKDAPEKKK